ncbi:ribosomal RNA processing protein 1 homolog A [Monodelphis domestica]|uniref:ribosomal RNA processing protein 1 homolog A n=1 Tax=Monodelphis domestica TaxID=13616 RepID=UPI0024E1B620|nr:ribosomal RNA processing protein 1 homolog A [Monodelphis domestica]
MSPGLELPAEIQLAQRLAGNEKTIRDRAVRKLRRYIRAKTGAASGGFNHEELLKIWKGLFYCMWMQDKPLLQEELGNTISQLIHVFQNAETQHLFVQTFWQTMNREWNGIDRLRLDKFYTLMRMLLNQTFEVLKRNGWEESQVELLLDMLMREILHPDSHAPCGVKSHFIDIYLEELTKVGAQELTADQNLKFIVPFCKVAAKTKDSTLLYNIVGGIFETILEQAPFAIEDLIRELNATQEESEVSEDESSDVAPVGLPGEQKKGKKDAASSSRGDRPKGQRRRGGKEGHGLVLQFNYEEIADRLFEMASRQYTPSLNRKRLYKLVRKFQSLAEGVFPQDGLPRRKKSAKSKRKRGRETEAERGTNDGKRKLEEVVASAKGGSRTPKRKGRKTASAESPPRETSSSDSAVPFSPQNSSSGGARRRKKGQGPKGTKAAEGFQEPNRSDATGTEKDGKERGSAGLEVQPASGKSKERAACQKMAEHKKRDSGPTQKPCTEARWGEAARAPTDVSPKPGRRHVGTPKVAAKQRKQVNGSSHAAPQPPSKVSSEMVRLRELQSTRASAREMEGQDVDTARMIRKKHQRANAGSVAPPQQKATPAKRELAKSAETPADCDSLPPPKKLNRSVSESTGSSKKKKKRIPCLLRTRMLFRSPGRRMKRSTRKDL